MTAVPSLDIVIVNWNAGGQLLDCLQSLQMLEPQPGFRLAKCVVVDNASSDASAKGLEHFQFELTVITNPENRGFGAACNQGAAHGSSDYILFLNPDIRLFADSLGMAISCLQEPSRSRVGLLGVQLVDAECRIQPSVLRLPTPRSLIYQMSGLDRLGPSRFPPFIMSDWDHRESREVDALQGAFLLARRSTFEQLNGFDERFFMYFEDMDLAHRARDAGWMSFYMAEARAFHRGGGTTETIKATRLSYWFISRVRYVAKHFGRHAGLKIVIASFALELWIRLLWNLINLSARHLLETVDAYREYARALPDILRV